MEFKWMNESEIRQDGNRIEIMATPQSDFFCNSGSVSEEGITPESLHNAPYYYTEFEGDRVKVGLLAQAPVGNGGVRVYEQLSIENRTVKNIRFGV